MITIDKRILWNIAGMLVEGERNKKEMIGLLEKKILEIWVEMVKYVKK